MTTSETIYAMEKMGELAEELRQTILRGWLSPKPPTKKQARAIASTFDTLTRESAGLDPDERWRIAGQIVMNISIRQAQAKQVKKARAMPSVSSSKKFDVPTRSTN